jgi:hypothetical protein
MDLVFIPVALLLSLLSLVLGSFLPFISLIIWVVIVTALVAERLEWDWNSDWPASRQPLTTQCSFPDHP